MFKRPLALLISLFITGGIFALAGVLLIDKQLELPTYCDVIGYISLGIGAIFCLIGHFLLDFYLKW